MAPPASEPVAKPTSESPAAPEPPSAPLPPQPASSHLPTSVSQPALTPPSAVPQVSSQISGYPHQSQQQPQPQPLQPQQVSPPSHNNHQQQPHHSLQQQYAQHGLPTHLDPAQAQHQSPLPQQQIPTSFYRQPEAQGPYFQHHAGAGTPPTSQAQDSPYTAFGQLSQQGPVSQLGAFGGAADYGYGDSQQRVSHSALQRCMRRICISASRTCMTYIANSRPARLVHVVGCMTTSRVYLVSSNSNSNSNHNHNNHNSSNKEDLHLPRGALSKAGRGIRPLWVITSHIHKINSTARRTIMRTASRNHLSNT